MKDRLFIKLGMCVKNASALGSDFLLASSFGPLTLPTCLWSLWITFHPRNKTGGSRRDFLSSCPKTSKEGLSCLVPGEENLPEHLSETANAKWKSTTVTKALRFTLPLTLSSFCAGLSCKPKKTTVVRNSTVEKEQIKHPLVPRHSSPKCIHLGLTCLSKTHSGETGIVQGTPEWDNRAEALPGVRKGQRPEMQLGAQGSCVSASGSCNSCLEQRRFEVPVSHP